jgi:hypothetical protein
MARWIWLPCPKRAAGELSAQDLVVVGRLTALPCPRWQTPCGAADTVVSTELLALWFADPRLEHPMEPSFDYTPRTRTRRWLLRGALFASLTLATPLRTMLVQDVAADKKSKLPSKKKRLEDFREICGVGGGTVTIDAVKPGGTTATCSGGKNNRTCTFTSKVTRCHAARRAIPDLPTHPLEQDSPLADPGDVPDHPLG